MRSTKFASGEFFHVFNRGVDKRTTFTCDQDFVRFVRSLDEFNDVNHDATSSSTITHPRQFPISERTPLVRIHSYCLMSNHFHLLLEEVVPKGISNFMHRLSTGYTKYFNLKYERTGCLFETAFKARHIITTDDFAHVSRYIHLNPLDLYDTLWKESPRRLIPALEARVVRYPWSSLASYLSSAYASTDQIIYLNTIQSLFPKPGLYRRFVFDWTLNRNPVFKTLNNNLRV